MPRKTAKLKTQQLHRQRLKEIRKFVGFDYDLRKPLTPYAIRKIKKYHDEISALTNRPYQVYRARRADHLRQAQEFAQHEKRLPDLRVAFIPTDGANKVKLSFTKGGVIAHTAHVTSRRIPLSVAKLLVDPEKHVNDKLRGDNGKSYTIQAGKYEIPQTYIKSTVGRAVARLVSVYGEAGGVTEDNNHYFGRWLHGVFSHTFDKQADVVDYLTTKQKSIKRGKAERRRAKRKQIRENARKRNLGG